MAKECPEPRNNSGMTCRNCGYVTRLGNVEELPLLTIVTDKRAICLRIVRNHATIRA